MDSKRGLAIAGAVMVALVVTVPAVYAMMGWNLLGVDLAYVVFGGLAVLSAATLGYGRQADNDAIRDRRRPLLAVCLFAIVVVVVYAVLAATGVVAMATLFDDGERAENFRNMDDVWPSADVQASEDVWELPRDEQPLPESYAWEGDTRSTAAFIDRAETTGLVVVHDGAVVNESYDRGYDETSRATSWSVAKSYTSALVGVALAEGHVESVDDRAVEYVPDLAGSGYANATVRDLLTMSSGVDFEESYSGTVSELNLFFLEVFALDRPLVAELAEFESARPPGQLKEYRTPDTMVLALILERATGESLANYTAEKLWRPVGMEADAFWNTDETGGGLGGCCLNAVPRDYARFGLLYLENGTRDGERIVPAEWVKRSTSPQPPSETAPEFAGYEYGYKWWIPEDSDHEFVARGIYGQYVYVNEELDVVIARTATDHRFDEHDPETLAVFRTISEAVAGAS